MSSEKIIIDCLSFDCVERKGSEFIIVCSMSEYNKLLEIYSSGREIPMSFRGISRAVQVKNLELKEIRDDVIVLLIEVFWI